MGNGNVINKSRSSRVRFAAFALLATTSAVCMAACEDYEDTADESSAVGFETVGEADDALMAAEWGECYARCCDESLQGPFYVYGTDACIQTAQGACMEHGHNLRIRFNGYLRYQRDGGC
jgi:hypothetical protein